MKRLIPMAIFILVFLSLCVEENANEVGSKVVNYIENLTGSNVELREIKDAGSNLYSLNLTVGEREYLLYVTMYVTKDGRFLFPSGYVISEPQQLSKESVGLKVVEYINKNPAMTGGATVSLSSVGEEESGIYPINISIEGRVYTVYATKDSKYLFLSRYDISRPPPTPTPIPTPEIPKTPKPEAHVFVMSHCPYGVQFLKAYIPVMELLGDKADLEVNFVPYIMHGDQEAWDNTRMYCIQRSWKEKFTGYLRCFVESGNSTSCISRTGISEDLVERCVEDADKKFEISKKLSDRSTWYNGRFPPYDVDATLASQFDVRGSPTFVVNGIVLSVERSPESVKNAICSAFESPPSECGQKLSSKVEQPGFGPMQAGEGRASSGTC